ncbi:hypothetical protein JXK06_00270 [Patescibacteria group bacterium]|nr:hypothetical protein [Patescibacteria group bacterium]
MTLKNYILAMSVLTVICWGVFVFIAGTINPFSTNWLGFLLFYISLGVALIGTSSILGLAFRFFFAKDEAVFNSVKNSFRQSFLFSLFIIALLILKSANYFSWLNLILLIIIFTILEIFLSSKKKVD